MKTSDNVALVHLESLQCLVNSLVDGMSDAMSFKYDAVELEWKTFS